MTALQQALIHAAGGFIAAVAAVVLCVTGHITGSDAVLIVLAAVGISGTGVAGSSPTTITTTTTAPPVAAVTTG